MLGPDVIGRQLWRQGLDFWKWFKVVGIESVDARDGVKLHRGDNRQIEYVASGDGAATKQGHHFINSGDGNRQYAKKTKHVGNRGQRVGGRTWLENTPRIGDDGIKLAKHLYLRVPKSGGGRLMPPSWFLRFGTGQAGRG